jgi:signal transduction histidine kinase
LEAAAAASNARALKQSVTINVIAAPETRAPVDTIRVRQAIDNLLDNALHHTPPGGTITLEAAMERGTPEITVRDDGPGFAALSEVRRELRLDADSSPGHGLGLRIAHTVATSHGGQLFIDNVAPHGAVVTLRLGRAAVAASPRRGFRSRAAGARLRPGT